MNLKNTSEFLFYTTAVLLFSFQSRTLTATSLKLIALQMNDKYVHVGRVLTYKHFGFS